MPYVAINIYPDNPHPNPLRSAYLEWYDTEEEARQIAYERAIIEEDNQLLLKPCSEWGDAWLKLHGGCYSESEARELVHEYGLRREDADQIRVLMPGAHAGGNQIWIIPTLEVMIPWVKERDDLPPHQKNRRHF